MASPPPSNTYTDWKKVRMRISSDECMSSDLLRPDLLYPERLAPCVGERKPVLRSLAIADLAEMLIPLLKAETRAIAGTGGRIPSL